MRRASEAALAAYEADMFPRSEREAVVAHETVELVFGDGAPYALANLFNGGDRQSNRETAAQPTS